MALFFQTVYTERIGRDLRHEKSKSLLFPRDRGEIRGAFLQMIELGCIVQWVACLTQEPEVPDSIAGLATYFSFSFR